MFFLKRIICTYSISVKNFDELNHDQNYYENYYELKYDNEIKILI